MGDEVRTLPSPLGLSDFELGVTLGTGSFGRVRFVTHKVCMFGRVRCACVSLYFRVYGNGIVGKNMQNIRA